MSPDDAFVRPAPDWVPRLIVIDGCNVGRSSCGYTRESVSCAGLLSIVRWLLLRDFECVIFLPVVYNNTQNANTTHVHLLSKLEELGLVTFTPARTGSGERRAFINYDDLYLTTMAERHGGCILSGDKFKDIHAHPNYSEFRPVIENRVVDLRFMFLNHDVVHFGDDIFYRAAPELFIQEDISTRAISISKKIYCSPTDPDIEKVNGRRTQFTAAKRKEAINVCDDLMYELCERTGIRPLRLTAMPGFQKRPREPEYEEVLPSLNEMQLVRDESVWQPGDAVTAQTVVPPVIPRFHNEEPEHAKEDEIDLIDFSDAPSPISLPRRPSSIPSDPFDLIELQLNSSVILDKPKTIPEQPEFKPLSVTHPPVSRSQWDDYFKEKDDDDSSVARYDRPPKPIEPPPLSYDEDVVLTAPTVNQQTSVAEPFIGEPFVADSSVAKPSVAEPSVVRVPLSWASVCKASVTGSPVTESPVTGSSNIDASLTVPSVLGPIETGSGEGSTRSEPKDDERERVKTQLCRIFPRDVVESVMAMNASCNPDFLAEQCLQMA